MIRESSAPIEIEWVGETPSDWSRCRVKALFVDSSGAISIEKLAYLEVDHYSIPAFDEFSAPVREDGASIASNKTLLHGGEILFSKLNCHKPRVWLVTDDNNIKVASTEFIALSEWHPRAVNKTFIQYLLGCCGFTDYIACFQTSVTNSHRRIKPEYLWRTPIPLPSLPEQERIAAYLDESCAAIDAAVTAKRRQLAALDDVRKSTIQRVVTRGLDDDPNLVGTGNAWMSEIPNGWNLIALKRVCEIQTGLTLGKEYEGPLIERPYLRVANVQDGHLDLAEITTIEVPAVVAERVELRSEDVLMTEGKDLDKLGRGTLWSGEIPNCLHQNHIFAVRCFKHKLLPKFLAYLTASQYGRDYFEATGKRTTNLASTNSTKVGMFPIPLPKPAEQEKLVEYLDEQIRRIRSVQSIHEQQVETLLAYRKSLIHECVTGQRRVTEGDVALVRRGESEAMRSCG